MSEQKRACLVFVDDHPDTAISFAYLASAHGYEAHGFESPVGLVKTLVSLAPDVVFSDINMPGKSGFEFAECIRRTPEIQDVFLVAITAHKSKEYEVRVMDSAFDWYCSKPMDLACIHEAVERAAMKSAASENIKPLKED